MPTNAQRIDRIEAALEQTAELGRNTAARLDQTNAALDRLTQVTAPIAASAVAHDEQIEHLIAIGEKHQERLDQLTQDVQHLSREWQAYLKTIRPQ